MTALILTIQALADTLVIRAGELLTDTTYAPLAPHGTLEGVGQIIAVGSAIIVVVIVSLVFWGLYSWRR